MRKKFLITAFLFIAALALAACAGSVRNVKFDSSLAKELGLEPVTLTAKVSKPSGDGPFPAIVMLHSCVGIDKGMDLWVSRFKRWGYVAMQVDSFGPRGISKDCTGPLKVSPEMRAQDAYDAKSYLANLPFVEPQKIALVGWSHGGKGAIMAVRVRKGYPWQDEFQASVAFYPPCSIWLEPLNAPLLILIGELDDWTTADRCLDMIPKEPKSGYEVTLKIYPEAYHCFDYKGLDKEYLGHRLKYNRRSAADAQVRVKEFLAKYLK